MATYAPSDTSAATEAMEIETNSQPDNSRNNHSNNIVNMECDSLNGTDSEKAFEFRTKGNEAFKNQDFDSALDFYTQSLRHEPNNAKTLSNRSAVHLQLKDYTRALEDANRAIRTDSSFVKSYFRVGKCHVANGNLSQAKAMFERAETLEPNDRCTKNEISNCDYLIAHQAKYEKAIGNSDFREAIFYIGQVTHKFREC